MNARSVHDRPTRIRHERRMPRGSILTGVLGVTLLAGCSDGVAPFLTRVAGVYALESVGGVALPAMVAQGGGNTYILLGDTLLFAANGSVERRVAYRHLVTTEPSSDTTYRIQVTFPYRVVAGRVTIGPLEPCPPNANCVGTEEGTITQLAVTVRGSVFWPGEPALLFVRVPAQ